MTRGKMIALLGAALLVIGVLFVVIRPEGAGEPPTEAAPLPEPALETAEAPETEGIDGGDQGQAAEAPPEFDLDVDMALAEETLSELAEDTVQKAEREVEKTEILGTIEDYHRVEDEVYASVEKYDDVKDRMKEAAAAQLDARAIALEDTPALLEAAREELDIFWEAGGLASAAAYENGYLARAMVELALEGGADNFELLSMQREAISSTVPLYFAGYQVNENASSVLWPILEKQRELIISGKVPLSSEAMLAMYDWTSEARTESAVAGWEWMVENADACGWSKMTPALERGLQVARAGGGFGTNLYAWPAQSREEHLKILATFSRGLPSQKGSREYREKAIRVWEKYDELSHGDE